MNSKMITYLKRKRGENKQKRGKENTNLSKVKKNAVINMLAEH